MNGTLDVSNHSFVRGEVGGGKGENGMKKLSLKIEGPGKKRFCLANIKVSWHEKLLD